MRVYILDASVVLNFLLGQSTAIEKKFVVILNQVKDKKAKLFSSYLLPLEVGIGLRYSLADEKLANEVLEKFLDLPVEFFILKPVHYLEILQMAYFLKTSFYDTSYHFLAKLLKGDFITCDANYFKKAEKFGNIKLL